jgi:hypothetical protein
MSPLRGSKMRYILKILLLLIGFFLLVKGQDPTCPDAPGAEDVSEGISETPYATGRPTVWFRPNMIVMNETQLHVKNIGVVSSMVAWGGCSAVKLRVGGGTSYQVNGPYCRHMMGYWTG